LTVVIAHSALQAVHVHACTLDGAGMARTPVVVALQYGHTSVSGVTG
jgi:hypothetical protein